jgi:hypothetical protein
MASSTWENAPFPTEQEWADFWNETQRFPHRSAQEWALKLPKANPWLLHKWDAYQRQSKKWPSLHAHPSLWFAPRTYAEQASSEATARAKAAWIKGRGPLHHVADLTSGSGIDGWALATAGAQAVGMEPNPALVRVLHHHERTLNLSRTTLLGKAEDFPWERQKEWDAVVVDPSRRAIGGQRWSWDHSEPHPVECWPLWTQKARQVLIKTSPLADPDALEKSFPGADALVFVAVDGEMKEIWITYRKDSQNDRTPNPLPSPHRYTVHTRWNAETFEWLRWDRTEKPPIANEAQGYVYLPDAALKASRCSDAAAHALGLSQWTQGVYTSHRCLPEWPGRVLSVQQILPPYQGDWSGGWSILSLGFPEKPEQIRKKLRCKEDSERFLIALQDRTGQKWFVHALAENT